MKHLRTHIPFFAFIRVVFNTSYRMVYPFLAVFARGLGVDIVTMSYAMTARSSVGALGPILASMADSRGRRFGMLFGLGLFIFGAVLVVFWPTFLVLVFSLILTALGKYIFDPAMQAYLGDRIPYERRGLAIALTEFGWSLAFILGIPLMGFIISRWGWMAPFPLLTLLGALTFFGLMFMLPEDGVAGTRNRFTMNLRTVMTHVPALLGLAVVLFATAGNEVVNLIFGVWLEDTFGLQIAALGAASVVIGLSELGGEGLVALLSDRLGKPRSVAVGLIINSLSALALPLLGQTTAGALVGLFLFYISYEFTIVSIIPMMTEIMPAARAMLMSFNIASLSLGRALGAPLAPFLYRFGFWVVALGAVLFNLLALLALRHLGGRNAEGSSM